MARAIRFVAVLIAPLLSSAAPAQMVHTPQPYAAMTERPIKALSDQQIADLRAGRGMGLALPAELNGYPGPSHVLEHADAMALSVEQRERTKALFDAMKAETIPLGERLIHQETILDKLFATREVEPSSLEAATQAIGVTQAALRAAHLRYHLSMVNLLQPEQVLRYAEIRGYTGGHQPHGHGGHQP